MTRNEVVDRTDPAAPSFAEATRLWLKVGLLGFGGPSAQIALMHRLLVDEKGWIGEAPFLHALNFCMLLPGPEAQQLAIYVGWLLHGTKGGLVAGTLFVLPGFLVILALSALYAGLQDVPLVEALFYGIKAAVLALVVEALIRIGKRVLGNRILLGLAGAAFVLIFFLQVPFPLIVLGAGLVGWLGERLSPGTFRLGGGQKAATGPAERAAATRRPSWRWALRVGVVCLALWWLPVAAAALSGPPGPTLTAIGLLFSKLAVVTFGGAYAVLAYLAQAAVETYGWLRPGEMLDGLGLAETTPGPLILVTSFVGFLAAYRDPGGLAPMLAGVLGAALTTWVTFVPCFLWIFMGAPFVERLRHAKGLSAALSAITAAVVGVILNLAVWFALHVVFEAFRPFRLGPVSFDRPVWSSLDPLALALSALAMLALLRWHLGLLPTLAGSAALGLLAHQLG